MRTNPPTAAKFTLDSMAAAPAFFLLLRRPAARAVEILADGGMIQVLEFGHRADALHLAFAEHRDAVGDLPQQIEVVRDHDDGQAEQLAQLDHQLVDAGRAGRVEAGRRLIEKQQFRIERQRARERCPLEHAAAQLGRILRPGLGLEAGQGELPRRDFIDQRIIQIGMLAQRQPDVFAHVQGAEQAAVLEHDSQAPAQVEHRLLVERLNVGPEHPDRAGVRAVQQDHFAQQRRFAGAAAADEREDLRAAHLEIEAGMHHMSAEARRQVADFDDHGVVVCVTRHVRDPEC